MRLLFISSAMLVLYAYLGYPLLLLALSKFFQKTHTADETYIPELALIIPIANESPEKIISKIRNTLELEYPEDGLEIVLALDNPNAETERLVDSLIPESWKVIKSRSQKGKEQMQDAACKMVGLAEVFVFTDTASILKPNTLYQLASHFSDPDIGVVDCHKVVVTDGKISSEGIYMKYENKIRTLEGNINTQVGVGGCLFAARKEVVNQLFLRPTQSDFSAALIAGKIGKRTILDEKATAMFSDLKDTTKEYNRKHRTILRGMNTLWHYKELLNPVNHGFFSFQLFSHKVCKWLVPMALITLLVSSLSIPGPFYTIVVLLQMFFYALAVTGILDPTKTRSWFKISSFFVMSNVAMLHATVDFIKGKQMLMWQSSER